MKAAPKQRFYYKGKNGKNNYEIDIVPFGELENDEKVAWPPEGSPEMSVKCFKDVMKIADTVIIDGGITIKMAPLAGQFLIKLDTWLDRHLLTEKDASDLLYIMENYYLYNLTFKQTVPSEVEDTKENFDLLIGGSKWIACEMREFLSPDHLHFYIEKLQEQIDLDEDSPLLRHMSHCRRSSNAHIEIRNALEAMITVLKIRK